MSKDLAIEQLTGDLLIQDLDLQVVEKPDYIIQKVCVRLRFILGEWFLDTTKGVPYFKDIFVKNPNIPNIENILKATILDTMDENGNRLLIELLEFSLGGFTSTNRTATVTFKARTIYEDVVEFSETVFEA